MAVGVKKINPVRVVGTIFDVRPDAAARAGLDEQLRRGPVRAAVRGGEERGIEILVAAEVENFSALVAELERIRVGHARTAGSDGQLRIPARARGRIRDRRRAVGKILVADVTRINGEQRAVLLREQSGIVMVVELREARRPQVRRLAGREVEGTQGRLAVRRADIAEVKFPVVENGARVVIPRPRAVADERGEVRLRRGGDGGKNSRRQQTGAHQLEKHGVQFLTTVRVVPPALVWS